MGKPVDHSDREHAIFAPSAAHRWLVCPGSVRASEGIEERTSKYAQEGTECHEASSEILLGNLSFDAATARLSEEQTWIVEEYTEYVFGLIDRLQTRHDRVDVWIEERVRAPDIDPDYHGTCDTAILAGRTLGIVDLKAGIGAVLPRYEDGSLNDQLASYALLAVEHHQLWDDIDTVRLTIVQPRVYDKPQTITIKLQELLDFHDRVHAGILRVRRGDETRVPGDHCFFCPAKGRCPALRVKAIEAAKKQDWTRDTNLRNYEGEDLISILNEAEIMQAHIDGIREHVRRELEKGRLKGMGWKLVPKRAVAKWTDPNDTIVKVVDKGLSPEEAFNFKIKTPLQLAKVLKDKGINFDLSSHFVKESSGPTLARADDPREEVHYDAFKDADK
jgi:hypothetical protein